jgi:hypothetical protein
VKKRKNKEIEITLGKVPSLNSFYSGSHWTKRKKAKDAALETIKSQLGFNQGAPYNSFRVRANVRYRYDLDNSIIAVKFTSDALKTLGWIKDDSPKYFRHLVLVWKEEIPKDEAEIQITLSDEHP